MFTPSGLWQILTALPELKDKETQFRAAMDQIGYAYDLPDYGGVRTEAQQKQLVQWRDEAVARGEPYYDVAPPGTGFHPYGGAFDITITTPANPTDNEYGTAAEVGVSVGLRPGYFFSRPDPFHFELDLPLETVKQMWAAHTTTVVAAAGGISAGVVALIVGGLYLLRSRS